MSIENDIQRLDVDIETAKQAIARMDALERLYNNKDFKEIILDGYFMKEASRLVLLRGDINISPEDERDCDKMINGVGCLRRFFQLVNTFGMQAKAGMEEYENTREELLAEQLTGGE